MVLRLIIATLLVLVGPSAVCAQVDDGRQAMVERIDELLAEQWQAAEVEPAEPVDDAAFLRRAYLDLVGTLPTVSQARRFLADASPDKRERLVEQLLASPRHAQHLATVWQHRMLSRGADAEQMGAVLGVHRWLRRQFARNQRFDNLVADLLVSTGGGEQGPALFYTALELKPEELATKTAQLFLGLQIGCAQCHDHPFDHWTQDDFWGYAAFFARLRSGPAMAGAVQLIDESEGEVRLPDTETIVPPKYPGTPRSEETLGGSRRRQLAIWTVSQQNPYLARATVNWAWKHLFGRGLVEPVDDLSANNPPSHPQLFAELGEYFIECGFDLRELFRVLMRTQAYQLSSRTPYDVAPELFAAMAVKPLTPEQIYDALAWMLDAPPATDESAAVGGLADPRRQQFVAQLGSGSQDAAQFELGVPQALLLMNGELIAAACDPNRSRLLESLAAPLFDDDERLEILYLATLTRLPSEQERDSTRAFIEESDDGNRAAALADVLWALLNNGEFLLNH